MQDAQRAYVHSPDLLTGREERNLELLRNLGSPRVCETAGVHSGVLFTRVAGGTPLGDVLAARPWETSALLDGVLLALRGLHGPVGAECLRRVAPIGERSVVGVFRRKFNGVSGGLP